MQLPMYCWAMLGTSLLVVLSTPVLAGTLILLSFDIIANTGFSILSWWQCRSLSAFILVLFSSSCIHYGTSCLWFS